MIDKDYDGHFSKTSSNPGTDMNVDRHPIKLNVDIQDQDDKEINATPQNLHGNHKY